MKFILKYPIFKILLILISFIPLSLWSQVDLYLSPNAVFYISPSAEVTVNGNINVANNATFTQANASKLYVARDFTIYGTFISTNGETYFIGSDNATIGGTGTISFYKLLVNKDINSIILYLDKSIDITNDFSILSGYFTLLNNSSLTIDLDGNLIINNNCLFDASTTGSQNHTLNFAGNFTNNGGTIDFNTTGGKINTNFIGTTDVNLGLSGNYDFNEININKTNETNIVNFDKAFTAADNFLTLTNGEFHITGNYSISNNFFKLTGSDYIIPKGTTFELDNPNATVLGQSVESDGYLRGKLHIKQGTFNVGTTGQSSLIYDNTSSEGLAELSITGGTANIYTSLHSPDNTRLIRYEQTGGNLNVGTGNGNSSNFPQFGIENPNSLFRFTNGTITLNNPNTSTSANDFSVLVTADTVNANSTLTINALGAGHLYEINSAVNIGSLIHSSSNNSQIILRRDLDTILKDIQLNGTGTDLFQAQSYNITLLGDFENNYANTDGFNAGTGRVIFAGSANQNIEGTQKTTFNILEINKTAGQVELNIPARVGSSIRLISNNSLLDLNSNNITLSNGARVYSDDGSNYDYTSFSETKCIVNSGSSANPLAGAFLVYEMSPSTTLPYDVHFPITTPGVITPMRIRLLSGGVTFGANPKIRVKPVPLEHPGVESPDRSLNKYWVVETDDISVNNDGAELIAYYDVDEVEGNEGSYIPLLYAPNWNNSSAYWRINPGVNNYVDINYKYWYSQQVDLLEGDWTIGEQAAGQATYYARQDGDYNDPDTWSKVYFNGTVSNTAPNKRSDRVRIQDHTVTISGAVAEANLVAVETGTEGRSNGILKIENDNYVVGDTFRVETNARFDYGHQQGITLAPNAVGAVQTDVREFSSYAIYGLFGNQNQESGDGIPDLVKTLIIDKLSTATATLSKNIQVRDTLLIEEGIFDLASNSVNGYTPDRKFIMNSGKFIVRSNFPINYTPPYLTNGTIEFNGTGNATIPSETSDPGVAQYYNLSIAGTREGNVTFENSGKIRISNSFDIDNLQFSNTLYRFLTSGSTVRLVKSGNQEIPYIPQSPTDSVVQLQYYNLELVNSGNKEIVGTSAIPLVVKNNLVIDSSAAFVQNTNDIEVQGNWTNVNGSFVPTLGKKVTFYAPTSGVDLTITTKDTTSNYFEEVVLRGPGNVVPQDNLKIKGDLTFISDVVFDVDGVDLFLYGDWINNSGTFNHSNSTAYFQSNTLQSISKTSGDETFYNLTLRNGGNLNSNAIGTTANNGLVITNNLDLTYGRINARDRFVQVAGTISRSGGGYINSALRRVVGTDAYTRQFEVGYENVYTPITFTTTGTGGTSGIVQILSDTITTTTTPIYWNSDPPTILNPTGSDISVDKHLARQWKVQIPSGSTFALGGSRKFDATLHFLGDSYAPNNDLRNGTNTELLDVFTYTGSSWIGPLHYGGTYPSVDARYDDSIRIKDMVDIGTIVVGEPNVVTYYTRGDGKWSDASKWSNISYDGTAATTYPGQSSSTFRAFIGAGHEISLDINVTVNNSASGSGIVAVDSSGVLDFDTYVISGNGEFRMYKNSTIKIGSSDGITATSAAGNVQTTTRNYNYSSHDLGTFIYNGAIAQNTGDGLPSGADSVYVLIIDKPGTLTLTLNTPNNLCVLDSLYLQSGRFNSGSRDIYLFGNMRKASGTDFQANSRTFYIVGKTGDTLTTENYSQSINFYNLQINKPEYTGNVVLSQNTFIEVANQLTFNSSNYGIIDALTMSNETTPSYLKLGTSGTISGARQIISASQGGGWIYGRLHRYINSGDANNVVFEVGDNLYYAPLEVDFRSGSGSTAGYLSAIPYYGFHPKLYSDPQSLYPVNPNRVVLIYWSLRKPSGSSFGRGTRNFDVTMRFPHPNYTTLLDCVGCSDATYYRGGDSLQWWQTMGRDHTSLDNSGTEYYCSDTRGTLTTPRFDYDGSSCTDADTPTSWIKVNNLNTTFGDDEIYANGDTLLADFVAGNRNSIRFYNFYSIKDGDWTDPTTWSTVSYNDTTNEARWDSDPNTYGFPVRQYDNAFIGNNKTVRLNSDIGHNDYSSPVSTYTLAGPSVKVYETGTLDFGTRTLRGNGFRVYKGGRIKVGAINGITTSASGNVQLNTGNTPTYSDSCNVVFTAEGSNHSLTRWTVINRNASTHYLEEVTIRRADDDVIEMQSITGNQRTNSSDGHNFIWDKTADLGKEYYLQINPSNSLTNRRIKAWIDYNYDGDFTDANETILNTTTTTDTTLRSYASFTIPSGTNAGTTHLRVGINNSTSNFNPTASGTGEFEEYTINIINPSTNVLQNTNSGLPTKLASFEVNSPRRTSIVRLSKNIEVVDSVKVSSGFFYPEASGGTDYTIKLMGAFIVDTLGGFVPRQGTVEFYGETRDSIRSKINGLVIPFYNLTINKAYSDTTIYVDDVDLSISNNFTWSTDNKISLTDNNTISLASSSSLTGTFSEDRMFVVSGNTTSGIIEKQFTTASGSGNPKTFTFPIGISDKYYPLFMYDTASSYGTTPIVKATVVSGKHPNRLTDNCLDIYWRTNFNDAFTNLDTLKYSYYPANATGDIATYIPSMWDGNSWVYDLGNQPWAKSSPVIIQQTNYLKAENTSDFAEWTAGQPLTFASGRIFYSINTGEWDNYINWSTDPVLKHSGPSASYYPGELFDQDTVNIDGHIITFDSDSVRIDSLHIGGTNSIAAQGQLVFGNTANSKKLFMRQLHLATDTGDEGYILPDASGTNQDTIEIIQDLHNEANSPATSGILQTNNSHLLHIKFSGNENSNLYGEGNWADMQQVILDKDGGLADTLIVNSQSYATASTTASIKPYFVLNSGILQNNSSIPLMIGRQSSNVMLEPGSGLHTKNGNILTFGSLTANANSTIYLENGDLEVGDEADENFYYYTNSQIDIIGSKFIVAGGFVKQSPVATTTLNMTGLSELIVAKVGYTAIEPTLDLSSSGTTINMSAGRIIVANGNLNSSSDVNISASLGTGFTGTSTLQIGDTSFTTSTNDIRIAGTTHINNLHLVDNGTTNLNTRLSSLNYNVKGDIIIDPLQNLDINGNTLNLQGDLLVWGDFTGTPVATTSSSWRMELNGTTDQSIVNYNTANDKIEIYSLRVNKTTGNVVLGNAVTTATTTLKVNDHMEFTASNNAFIDALTYNELSSVGPNANGLGIYQITRTNLGHINGTLQRYIPVGNQVVNFPIGLDTITSYRPVELDITGSANTAGYLNATVYKDPHPQIATSGIIVATSVPRYWRVVQDGTAPFDLGPDGEYKITTTFINPNDVIDTASLSLFEHRLYDDTPAWNTPDFLTNSTTSVTSDNVTIWGDFIIGEPNTVTFYSIADGNWQDVNTWSLTSYDIPNPPTRIPNMNTDIVRIGNGKKVTLLDDGTYPNVRNVIVETYNSNPGYLQIEGNLNYLSGLVFQLNDANSLGIQHVDGIRPTADGNIGPIHTTSRNFGVSRYIFNNAIGNQVTGTALPNYVQSIIIDNTSTNSNKKVYLSNFPGAPIININDSLHIRQGTFNLGNRNIRLLGNLVVDSVFNEGKIEPLTSKIILDSNTTKYIVMKNRTGLNFYDLDSDEGNTYISREGANVTANTHLNISGTLNFTGNTILILGDSTNINLTNNSIDAIQNYSATSYIRTSRQSGSLIRALSNSGLPKTYFYPIGSYESSDNYTPFELTISSMTTEGKLGARTSPGDRGGFPGGHARISTAPNAEYLKRYWTLDSITAVFTGVAKFSYLDGDVYGTETGYNRLGRWRPVREVSGGPWTQYINPTINFTSNYFETTSGYSSSDMMGDWTIGNAFAFRRIFFSRQNGDWNDPNSWTYSDTHSGPIFGTGIWPDSEQDSVVIGGGNGTIAAHEITMNVDADVQGTALGTSAGNRGILNTNNFTLSGDYFTFADYSTLKISSSQGISSLGNSTGNILTTITREFNTNGIYEYNGSTNQIFGNGLPNSVYSLIINNSGTTSNNIVSFDKNISIANDFNINQGVANLVTYTANNNVSSGIFSISANARMIIGGVNDLLSTVNNYTNYNIDTDSYIQFDGNANQTISNLPTNLINGLGNVDLTNSGTKYVNNPLLIRGNLTNYAPSILSIDVINSLEVRKSVINESQIINQGILEIGE